MIRLFVVLFCLFCSVLFCSVLFVCSVLFYSVLFCSILFVLFCLFCFVSTVTIVQLLSCFNQCITISPSRLYSVWPIVFVVVVAIIIFAAWRYVRRHRRVVMRDAAIPMRAARPRQSVSNFSR